MKKTYMTVEGLNKALRKLPKEAAAKLRDASQRIAGRVARDAGDKARSLDPQARLIASSIVAKRDRTPVIQLGGNKRLPPHSDGRRRVGNKQTYGWVALGSNFGSKTYKQFPAVTKPDRIMFKTIEDDDDVFADEYGQALQEVLDDIKAA